MAITILTLEATSVAKFPLSARSCLIFVGGLGKFHRFELIEEQHDLQRTSADGPGQSSA
jgi:hypothetical protein